MMVNLLALVKTDALLPNQSQIWESLLMFFLITCSVVSICAVLRAKKNLELEHRVLKTIQGGKENIGITRIDNLIHRFRKKEIRDEEDKVITDPYTAAVYDAGLKVGEKLDSSASVQRYLDEKHPLRSGYVSDRLFAILSSVNTSNLVRKAPPLEDLHELTLQRERGGISTSIFRMLAPGILVLGILGTLLGVHHQLAEVEEQGVFVLSGALMPGAYAVFFTIIVMVYRGSYNRALSHFVSDFDEYTLTCLLPFFRPVSQSQADMEHLESVMSEVAVSYGKWQELSSSISRYNACVQAYEKFAFSILEGICDSLSACLRMEKRRRAEFKSEQDWQQQVAQFVVSLNKNYVQLSASMDALKKRIDETAGVIRQLSDMDAGGTSTRKWEELKAFEQRISQAAERLHDFHPENVGQYVSEWTELVDWMKKDLPKELERYKKRVKKIDELDGNIDTNIENYLGAEYVTILGRLLTRLEQRYALLLESSDRLKAAVCDDRKFVKERLEDWKTKLYQMPSTNDGVSREYPTGLKGLRLRLKDIMMKWERTPRLRGLYTLLWVATIVWTLTLIFS